MTPLFQIGLLCLLQSTLLLTLGLLSLRLTRKRGPALQTLIGRATLIAVALTLLIAYPLAGHIQPLWRINLPTSRPVQITTIPVAPLPAMAPPDVMPTPPALRAASDPNVTPPPTPTPSTLTPPVSGGEMRSIGVGSFWPLGTLFLLLWLAACLWHLTLLRRTAIRVTSGPAIDLLADLTPRPPKLFTHPRVRSPFLAGICHPAIFLPATAEADFSPEALRAILAHELAHRDRRDNFWLLLSRLLTALLWPQPLLWLLCRRLEEISEEACDQSVLAHDCPPRAYADCLLSLAERWQPSHRERTLGVGVAPYRSSLGRRITLILANARPLLGPTQGLRSGITACALLAISGSVLLLNTGVDVPHFTWAKQQGWAVQPIRIIDFDHPGLTRVASLPYDITEQDKASLKRITDREGFSDVSPGAKISEKEKLIEVLTAQPHFFYAEYLLSIWYRQHKDKARASALLAQSLRDAPVVLAGRYEYDNGTPVVGLEVGTTIVFYSPAHLKGNSAAFRYVPVRLEYSNLVTDADGCYYIPVFRAIYSQNGLSWQPDQLNALTASRLKAHAALITPGPSTSGTTTSDNEERLNKGFIAESRVGILPQTQVRAKIALSAPFHESEGSIEKPIRISANRLTISWPPYPKAVHYRVQVDEHHPRFDKQRLSGDGWGEVRVSSSNPSRLGLPISQTHVSLNFTGNDPIFNRTFPYTLTVIGLGRDGEPVSESDQYYFQTVTALAPLPLTRASLTQQLGPGITITSLQSQKDKIVVNAITTANLHWSLARDNALTNSGRYFGFSFASWTSKPGISMNEDNAAQTMQIVYSHDGF